MSFQKLAEDFICEHCLTAVTGTGYTNHCPKCLTSKHVDIDPGDRASACGGLMDVVGFETKHGEMRMIHQCRVCCYQKTNRVQEEDDPKQIAAFMKQFSEKSSHE